MSPLPEWLARLRVWLTRSGEDSQIDALIKPPRQRFVGYDDKLRQQATERRRQADYVRQTAARWDSNPDVVPPKDEPQDEPQDEL